MWWVNGAYMQNHSVYHPRAALPDASTERAPRSCICSYPKPRAPSVRLREGTQWLPVGEYSIRRRAYFRPHLPRPHTEPRPTPSPRLLTRLQELVRRWGLRLAGAPTPSGSVRILPPPTSQPLAHHRQPPKPSWSWEYNMDRARACSSGNTASVHRIERSGLLCGLPWLCPPRLNVPLSPHRPRGRFPTCLPWLVPGFKGSCG
ncbi:uncharacterized protein B0H64DRAFT_83997 [Chaetomium fimeti]|uniref:Uncharacterized protein n=1 Tax=Chaetomium fimeti TaxID=1854472 RepID=A0AAE0HLW2_9PEZI|nr:hypothetical protein B0H64DRAFT_83997 [Chaetomium fimeti]